MSHERFDLLLEKYLEKALTPSEREEFQALLEQDSKLRGEYISALTQASMLRRIHRNKITHSARIEAVNIKKVRRHKRGASESNIFKRKGSYFALAALAAMVVCAVLLKFSQNNPVEPSIELSDAPAEKAPPKLPTPDLSDVTVETGKSLKLAAEDYFGRKIITSERASALVSYKDGTTIELKASTQIKLSLANSNKGKELEVLVGRIIVNAAPQPKDMPLQIKSSDGTASVIGTLFWLNVDKQGTRVDLLDGKINLIRADNTKIQLETGQKAVMASNVALTATPLKLEDGPLLYNEEFDAEFKNWKSTGAKLALSSADISGKPMPTAKMDPIPPGALCTAMLDFSQVLPRHADSIAINFNMRSLIPLNRDNQIWFVPYFGDGIKVEDDLQANPPKQPKYTFRRFVWKKLRMEIHRTRGENGIEGFRYRTFIDGALFQARKGSGPSEGLRFSTIDLPFEFSNLQVYELIPVK